MNKVALLLIGAAVLACGCANNEKLREADLARLAEWLPGAYDNRAQVDSDLAKSVMDVHAPIALDVVAVSAQIIGEELYYVQQSDATNPRRVISQQLYSFEKTSDNKAIAHTIYNFKEPDRWASGHDRPDIFKSLVPDDLSSTSGCELKWEFAENRFTASSSAASCRGVRGSGARTEIKIELTATEFKLSERTFDSTGNVTSGRSEDPFFDFRKGNR
ncbi:MAG TPA: chromophore lyase CpcT/CpeT [Steroidobacteraceae bacterium]|nr:chromophore lyase CpcT/CpeT [Steroidobacteraceae bacterium]